MKYLNKLSVFLVCLFSLLACSENNEKSSSQESGDEKKEVNLYTTRHYDIDKELYKEFQELTGIKVNVVKEKSAPLLVRMEQEKDDPQADIFLTTGYPTIHRAVELDLVEPIVSKKLLDNTTPRLRDAKNRWYALSSRLRIIVIDKDYQGTPPKTYWDLSKPEYKGQLLIRSGTKNYNISWIASLISLWGEEKTREFLKGFVANFARTPEGNDRKQISDIYAKKGKITVVNSYYLGRMLNSDDPEERKASEPVSIIYPEDGVHENISGFCRIKNAKNKDNALKLLEFMTSKESQTRLTNENYEYPVNTAVKPTEVFLKWGKNPKLQNIDLASWGVHYELAGKLIIEAGWN